MLNKYSKYSLSILVRMYNCRSYCRSLSKIDLSLLCDALVEKYDDYLLCIHLGG